MVVALILINLCGANAQTTQPIRTALTTNNMMNAPFADGIVIWNAAAGKWSNGVNTASSTNLPSYLQTQLLTNLAANGINEYATNIAWANFFKYDTNAAAYIVRVGVTNEPARLRADNFVRMLKRDGLWNSVLDAASLFREHQPNATSNLLTFKSYATNASAFTHTLDGNGLLFTATSEGAAWHVPNTTNYTLMVTYRNFTNQTLGTQRRLIGIINTNGDLHGSAGLEFKGDDFLYFASQRTNNGGYSAFAFSVTTNAPAQHSSDAMRHSAGYWMDSLGGYKTFSDGLYSKSNTTATIPTNINSTELVIGGAITVPGGYQGVGFKGYVESWILFSGQLTDAQAKNADMAMRSLSPQTRNLVFEGTSLDAWNGIGAVFDVFISYPYQYWLNPSVSNTVATYNHAMAGASLITPQSGFGSLNAEYTNTIQYLRPEKNGGAMGVDSSVLILGAPANDFFYSVSGSTIYAAYLNYITRANNDGFEVWATTAGAAQFLDTTQDAERTWFNNALLTNSGLAKRLIRRDMLFPNPKTNGVEYFDGTHLSVTGNLAVARHLLDMDGARGASFVSVNSTNIFPNSGQLELAPGTGITITPVFNSDQKKTVLTFDGGSNFVVSTHGTAIVTNGLTAGDATIRNGLTAGDVTITNDVSIQGNDILFGNGAFTGDRALYLDIAHKVQTSPNVSSTELGYLDGVTSGIQAQIDALGGGGGAGSMAFAASQFSTNTTVTIISGAVVTNLSSRGVTIPTITASRPAYINPSGNLTNASGTPDGTKFMRDDGVLAVPIGSGGGTNFSGVIITNAIERTVLNLGSVTNPVIPWGTTNRIIWSPASNAGYTMSGNPGQLTNEQIIHLTVCLTNAAITSIVCPTNTIDGIPPLFLTAPSTNDFDLIYDGFKFYIADGQVRSAGTGPFVLQTNATVITPTTRYVPLAVTGFGPANTNFTLLSTVPETIINGFTNVSIRGSGGYDDTLVDYWNLVITNGSGTDRTVEFSAVTNRWRFAGTYGTNAPSVLTNATRLLVSARQHGTNVQVGYAYFAWP